MLCLAMATAVTASAQLQQIKTVSGRLIPYGSIATTVTTDSTLRVIDSIVVVNNTGGIIEVTVVGSSTAGDAITGKQIFRYKKASGTITLSSATNILATVVDAGLGTATGIGMNEILTRYGKAMPKWVAPAMGLAVAPAMGYGSHLAYSKMREQDRKLLEEARQRGEQGE